MMTPNELRKSILQLAIQGKLVEQRPDEGSGADLLREILAEKERLVKEGRIKKEKPLPEVKIDEAPFEIPENWVWVRFSDILDVRDGTHDTPKYVDKGIPLITSKNLINGSIDFETAKNISEEDAALIDCRSAVEDGDILFAMIGTIGNPVLVKKTRRFCIKNMALFKPYNKNLFSMKYLLLFLEKEQLEMKKKASGGVQSFVSLKFLRSYLIPLPPLSEQRRIVERLATLLPLCDRYERSFIRLSELEKSFPSELRKSLLQEAITGRLVEQRAEEGTGADLYRAILREKERLVKEGRIKKEKALPEVKIDEAPFGIPDSWIWVRLGNVGVVISGGTPKTTVPEYWDDNGIPWLTPADMKFVKGMYVEKGKRSISESGLKNSSAQLIPKGSILYSSRAPIGYIAIALNEITTNQGFKSISPIKSECSVFIYYCLIALTSLIIQKASGTTFKEISGSDFALIPIPLPPLSEQRRIVERLETLLPLCDRLGG